MAPLLAPCMRLALPFAAARPQPTPNRPPQACTEVAATWLPHHDPDRYLGSPAGDLEVLASPEWQAAAQEQPGRVRPLLEALLALWGRQLEAARSSDGMGGSSSGAGSKRPRLGPFQSAVVQPKRDPAAVRTISDEELAQQARALLQRLQRALPRQAAQLRGQRTAAAFAEAEARARRQRRL